MADKEKKEKKMWGRGGGNDYKLSMLRIEQGGKCLITFDFVSNEPFWFHYEFLYLHS